MKGVLYVGFDESNNGRYPEIFTTTFSFNNHFGTIRPPAPSKLLIPKLRHKSKNPLEKLSHDVDYSFLIWDDDCQRNYSKKEITNEKEKMLGYICVSLLKEKLNYIDRKDVLEDICLYLDGEKSSSEKGYIREFISDLYGSMHPRIHIQDGGDLDRRCKLVSLSDSIAYCIHRKIAENKQINANVLLHKKPFLWELVS